MDATIRTDPGRVSDLLDVLGAFRDCGPAIPVGAAIVFVKLVEGAGGADLAAVARETGIPFSQVCRFADNLSGGVTRNVSGLGLAARVEGAGRVAPRYALTEAGRDLAARLGACAPREAAAA